MNAVSLATSSRRVVDRVVPGVMLAGWLLFSAHAALAQELRSVQTTAQGSSLQIDLQFSEPLRTAPNGFAIANPARIALDFEGVQNRTGVSTVAVEQGNLRNINVVEAGERTRMVFNLRQAMRYTTETMGNTLRVSLLPIGEAAEPVAVSPANVVTSSQAAAPVAAAPLAATTSPEPSAAVVASAMPVASTSVRGVDFRRTAEGAGRIIVDLANPGMGVDVQQRGSQVIVDFLGATLPPELLRRWDVTDFGTPVQTMTTSQEGDRVRLTVQPTGLWEHLAYQTDNQFVLDVTQIVEDPNRLFQGTRLGYQGERLSLNFQDVDVRSLLQVIGDFTNTNIVASDSVGGNITLRLRDVPWDQALDIVLEARGLGMRKNGNVMLIAPREEIAARERQDLESRAQLRELEPLRTEAFQLNYQRAADISALLTETSQRILSERGSVVAEPRTNQLFVNDVGDRLDAVREMLRRVDTPSRQVMIEARIVEVSEGFQKDLGARLNFFANRPVNQITRSQSISNTAATGSNNSANVSFGDTGVSSSGSAGQTGSASGSSSQNFSMTTVPRLAIGTAIGAAGEVLGGIGANLPSGGAVGGRYALSLFSPSLRNIITLEIAALEADNGARTISSPRVVTADRIRASISQGEQIPFTVTGADGAPAVQQIDALLSLNVTPQITPEGTIIMEVDINNDEVSNAATVDGRLRINKSGLTTQVMVESGGTVAIGGIFRTRDFNSAEKVPVLGDLPGVGALFRARSNSTARTELMVFITPTILDDTAWRREP